MKISMVSPVIFLLLTALVITKSMTTALVILIDDTKRKTVLIRKRTSFVGSRSPRLCLSSETTALERNRTTLENHGKKLEYF